MGRGLGWGTHRGPCQPLPCWDSVILWVRSSLGGSCQPSPSLSRFCLVSHGGLLPRGEGCFAPRGRCLRRWAVAGDTPRGLGGLAGVSHYCPLPSRLPGWNASKPCGKSSRSRVHHEFNHGQRQEAEAQAAGTKWKHLPALPPRPLTGCKATGCWSSGHPIAGVSDVSAPSASRSRPGLPETCHGAASCLLAPL